MMLIGQYDSPFVRRVAIALRLYELPFEHQPWSTFSDADKIAAYKPLRRVPTLVLERQFVKPERNRDAADEGGIVLADQHHGVGGSLSSSWPAIEQYPLAGVTWKAFAQ